MNAKNFSLFFSLAFVLSCGVMFAAYAQTATPSPSVEVTVFVDEDSLTVYIPSGQPEFLDILGFAYMTDDGIQTSYLNEYFDIISAAALETPICFRLLRDDTASPAPLSCPENNTFVHDIHTADLFWYRAVMGNYRLFVIVQGTDTALVAGQLCPSNLYSCTFVYPFFTIVPNSPHQDTAPPGYSVFDSFDGSAFGGWEVTNDSAQCSRILLDGSLQIECFGSETEDVSITMLPANDEDRHVEGVAMGFYTLPVQGDSTQWGKYQLQVRFGSDCDGFERAYNISILPNELRFVEMDVRFNALNSPAPVVEIIPGDTQVIRIEYEDGLVYFYHNNNLITTATPPSYVSSVCWMFQSDDNDRLTPDGYRGMVVQWIAIK